MNLRKSATRGEMDDEQDSVRALDAFPPTGDDDIVGRIMSVYQHTMKVYGPAAATYQAAVEAGQSVNGFSTSANR